MFFSHVCSHPVFSIITNSDYRQAIAIREKLATNSPRNLVNHRGLAQSNNNLGELLMEMSRLSEAEAHFQRTQALVERLVTEVPFEHEYRRGWGIPLINLAPALGLRGPEALFELFEMDEIGSHRVGAKLIEEAQHAAEQSPYWRLLNYWETMMPAWLRPAPIH